MVQVLEGKYWKFELFLKVPGACSPCSALFSTLGLRTENNVVSSMGQTCVLPWYLPSHSMIPLFIQPKSAQLVKCLYFILREAINKKKLPNFGHCQNILSKKGMDMCSGGGGVEGPRPK